MVSPHTHDVREIGKQKPAEACDGLHCDLQPVSPSMRYAGLQSVCPPGAIGCVRLAVQCTKASLGTAFAVCPCRKSRQRMRRPETYLLAKATSSAKESATATLEGCGG